MYWAIFGMVTNKQPGEPRASLLLTSVRRQSFAIRRRSKGERQDSGGASANDVKVINTSAFINTKIDYGLYFVFHLMDSVTLTIISLIDNGVSGFAWGADACPCLPQFGWRPEDPLSSDQLASGGTMGKQWLLKQFCLNHPVEHIQKPKLPKLYVRVETSTSYFIIHNQFVK